MDGSSTREQWAGVLVFRQSQQRGAARALLGHRRCFGGPMVAAVTAVTYALIIGGPLGCDGRNVA